MTTNIMISREAYDDSLTTDDVFTDIKLDNVEKYQKSMLDETDSINMNEAIDDSSLLLIDSKLNGATDDKDDDADFEQKAGKIFENIESNLNANEIENELSDTRVENRDDFESLIDNEDLNVAAIEDLVGPKEDVDDDLIIAVPVDGRLREDYLDEIDEIRKIDQDVERIPQYIIDQNRLQANKAKDNDDPDDDTGIDISNENSEEIEADENLINVETESTESIDYPNPESIDPEYPDPESIDPESPDPESIDPEYPDPETIDPVNPDPESSDPNYPDPEQPIEPNANEDFVQNDSNDQDSSSLIEISEENNENLEEFSTTLESDQDINNQFDVISESTVDDDSAELSNNFNSADSNQESESFENADSVDENLISNDDIQESNDENSIQNEIGSDDDSNVDANSNLEIPNSNVEDESNDEFQENTSQNPDSVLNVDVESENVEKSQRVLDELPSILEDTTKSSIQPASKRRSKLSVLNKFKSNQQSRINKSPQRSFKKQLTSKFTQRGQRLSSRKKQSNDDLSKLRSKGLFSDINSGQLLEINEKSLTSSNDDDFPQQHDIAELKRHKDTMNANSDAINRNDVEDENSLNNPKSLTIESDINNENFYPDINIKDENINVIKSRQQQISKLSKQSPASDSNDSPQSDNLDENESNQVDDSMTVKVKNDNNELQFVNSIDGRRQHEDENLQHDNNQVDDNDREYENDELKNNQIGDENDGNGGMVGEKAELTRDMIGEERRPALINKFGMRVNRQDLDDTRKSNDDETIDSQDENATT
ncbi:germ cell nuclear acidic protein-like [Chironomus tepperi]|uniref:germ cell nuclear acidic protein-like n=1 Tax=Chironomus tepperi TaxID=113505 RepID=UPI00391F5F5B